MRVRFTAERVNNMSVLEHMTQLNIYSDPVEYRKTSIICTIGPKTMPVDRLVDLIGAGMNIVRLNFSHGSYEYHGGVVKNAREAAKQTGVVLAIALDTKGPEIRTGLLTEDEITLSEGQVITLTTDASRESNGDKDTIYVDYKKLPSTVKVGGTIFIDDGLLSLEVVELGENNVVARVRNPGKLGSRKGVNLPDVDVDLPAISEKDASDLRFGVEQDVDMIFASFIRKASDVRDVRAALGPNGKHIKIIAKIENHEGVRNFDDILNEADGIMVARGDLGIEIPPEKVFVAQKMMISKCNIAGKPVICATQMLESMTFNPRPTRAEVSDVANAVLDGSDCVMLSGETAKGSYPIEAVTMMAKICCEAEAALCRDPLFEALKRLSREKPIVDVTEAIACSAVNAAAEAQAKAIIVLTISGTTARLVAKYRPACPIITVTRNGHTARCCHLSRGCHPLIYEKAVDNERDWQQDVEDRIIAGVDLAKSRGLIKTGDVAICIQGWRGGVGNTNTIRLLHIN